MKKTNNNLMDDAYELLYWVERDKIAKRNNIIFECPSLYKNNSVSIPTNIRGDGVANKVRYEMNTLSAIPKQILKLVILDKLKENATKNNIRQTFNSEFIDLRNFTIVLRGNSKKRRI